MMFNLTDSQTAILNGEKGHAVQKSMQILVALGKIYGADCLLPVVSVQIAGVSYDNLGEAGLSFLAEMAEGGGKVNLLTTLNPAGMDFENWENLGIEKIFAQRQIEVINVFKKMGVLPTCTCTPYLIGNLPHMGQHLAWSESSAVCYANSVLGARTNREGGPSALASALTGFTPNYGLHLDKNRSPNFYVLVNSALSGTSEFGALGKLIGDKMASFPEKRVPFISGIQSATLEELKSFCASISTFGGVALFHIPEITPEAILHKVEEPNLLVSESDLANVRNSLDDARDEPIDFVSLGCPHLSINEIAKIAVLLSGKQVKKEFWITTSRSIKKISDAAGYTKAIEIAGAKFAADTCCVVAPIRGRFHVMATDSAKACYYGRSKNGLKIRYLQFDDVVKEALK